ncbi:helix-turn-helix transcriptional regulator [Cohnella nanjingensis]|uniref:Helix-turn-helix transcriptional regulator n=1 Tax=Cohnella nanjingensis TaxID=1387779 RepID=A0A7X0RT18_9BACL|nr:helix-turn-helix transcriptional regulator [Cohnella nanjingensis]
MNRKRPITAFGWAIKERLAAKNMDQREFCELHGIPPSRLAEMITGTRKSVRYRKKVEQLLGLDRQHEKQAK